MKSAWSLLLGLVVAFLFVANTGADEKKAKTLKGQICCAKCCLKIEGQETCHTVISVKDNDKQVVYWFDKDASKKHHKKICQKPAKGSVKGSLSEKDGKHWVKVSAVEWADE